MYGKTFPFTQEHEQLVKAGKYFMENKHKNY